MHLRGVFGVACAAAPRFGARAAAGFRRGPLCLLLGAVLALCSTSCVLLPARFAPGLTGRVVDRASGEPVAGAVVLVRFDGRYGGDDLPDRDTLGHAEAVTDADGRFAVDTYVRAGLMLWPHFRTERRVVGVIRNGYRCASPLPAPEAGELVIPLERAEGAAERRDSCRPVSARRGEADAYMTAWRAAFPPPQSPEERERELRLARLLDARATLGFGANCEGPVHDLALSPDGERVAFAVEGATGTEVKLVAVGDGRGPSAAEVVASSADVPPRRLAWTGSEELVLWQPSTRADRAISPSIFAPGHHEVVWRSSRALPAAIDRGTPASSRRTSPHAPLEPADLSDEAETRWLGRTFRTARRLDPDSGLARELLRVRRQDGTSYEIELPGESCGGTRFGRPHLRISAGGGSGLDLRWIDGGCHAVRIDLDTGAVARLDAARAAGECRTERRLPPAQLAAAVHGWSRDLEQTLAAAGASPGAAYSIHIAPGGSTRVRVRSAAGELAGLDVPAFPLKTPLRRIDVTTVGPATPTTRITIEQAPAKLEPL
jgi:hypothetical protein